MRIAANLEAFRNAPLGACIVGPTFIHFSWSEDLWGLVLFGKPSRDDAQLLARSLAFELEDGGAQHAFYLDARKLEAVDPDAFTDLIAIYRANFERAATMYTRLGLLIPTGVEGAIVTGFYGRQEPPFPVRVLPDVEAACAWLPCPEELDDRLTELVAERSGAPTIVLRVRGLLAAEEGPREPADVAHELGMSARTLQRRLSAASTSLQKELTGVRIEAAKKRLTGSDAPVTVIALDLGFATSQHFSRQFRDATGLTPSEWRSRHRR